MIRADYYKAQNEVVLEAWGVGWEVSDVQGSLSDIEAEKMEVVKEWEEACARIKQRFVLVKGGKVGVKRVKVVAAPLGGKIRGAGEKEGCENRVVFC